MKVGRLSAAPLMNWETTAEERRLFRKENPAMNKKPVNDIDVANRQFLGLLDLNVPLENGARGDDPRIRAALPTIQFLLEHNSVPILCSHLGRPKGKPNPKYSLKPVAERLGQLLDRPVQMAPDCIGSTV